MLVCSRPLGWHDCFVVAMALRPVFCPLVCPAQHVERQSENDRPSLTTLPAWFRFVRCGWNARFRTHRDEDIEASLTGCTDRVTHPSGCSQLARLRSALIAIPGEPSAMAVNIFEAERSPTGSTTSACTPIFRCVTSIG